MYSISQKGPLTSGSLRGDIVTESKNLFLLHLKYEVRKKGLELPKSYKIPANIPETKHSRKLRKLANTFVKSHLRTLVHELVQNIDLESLSFNGFKKAIKSLFQHCDSIRQKILVFFYYCTDVIVRVLHEKLTSFNDVLCWTTCSMSSQLSGAVEDYGGWEVILSDSVRSLPNFYVLGLSVVGLIAISFFIRKQLK